MTPNENGDSTMITYVVRIEIYACNDAEGWSESQGGAHEVSAPSIEDAQVIQNHLIASLDSLAL